MPESQSQVATFLDKIAMAWQLATLAQLVEQLPRKEQVRSSILLGGSSVATGRISGLKMTPSLLLGWSELTTAGLFAWGGP